MSEFFMRITTRHPTSSAYWLNRICFYSIEKFNPFFVVKTICPVISKRSKILLRHTTGSQINIKRCAQKLLIISHRI